MRIAQLTYSTKPRGGVVHTLALAEALAGRGHEVERAGRWVGLQRGVPGPGLGEVVGVGVAERFQPDERVLEDDGVGQQHGVEPTRVPNSVRPCQARALAPGIPG